MTVRRIVVGCFGPLLLPLITIQLCTAYGRDREAYPEDIFDSRHKEVQNYTKRS
jgi:hypothetical protein